jgi:hypothetical protein
MWEPPTKEGLHSAARQPQRFRADGTVKREAIDPETHRKSQARAWKAKTEAARIRREINVTQEGFARMLGVSLGIFWGQSPLFHIFAFHSYHPSVVERNGKAASFPVSGCLLPHHGAW